MVLGLLPSVCRPPLPAPQRDELHRPKSCRVGETPGLTVQMEKLRFGEGTKCPLSRLQKASSLPQVWALGRPGSGHRQGQRSSRAFRKPSPPKGRRRREEEAEDAQKFDGILLVCVGEGGGEGGEKVV